MTLTSEDIEWFKKAAETVRKGYYPDGNKAVEGYRRIFAEEIKKGSMRGNLSPRCGGCIKQAVGDVMKKINELEKITQKDETDKAAEK